ncbi:MFS transporter [Microbacterium azadirachtae]|uniref:MFS transporter n=1 Tax=Microbacterium azadirachtae TaxID=582680 RepID=UPI00087F727E|nr:MFS transporter [Microbacterium azadirachtae]SDL68325.1 drug resistance transporter, EmrB/QacA subfamily [Microbacterium azadirachtae]SEF97707.1 drug resistance transporter, EmrB/QacA subfamily [Microbacterium azadirachtae]SEG00038.1 drug resistance transporter, EmrB/QacA subfamily [Microbacterium azadirachtae]
MTPAPALARARTYPSLRAAWIPLAALCLAFFVEMVDNTLLSIALPTIGRELGGDTTSLQWITGAYSLTFGGLLLTAGSIADRFGRRRVLQIGLGLFGLISLAVLLITSTGELIVLRAALGVAAAAMAPITNSLVFRLFDDEKLRMRAITLMMVVGMSGFVLGPLLGGTMLTHLPWQWLLLVNAPIALIAAAGVRFGVPADSADGLTTDRLDLPGAALSILTIGLACYVLTSGIENGWASPLTLAVAVGAVVSLVLFIVRERRAASPMLDLSLFRQGTVRGAAIAQIGTSVAMAGVMFALILHFQYAWGWSPLQAGLANLPLIATMILATPLTEWLVRRCGHRIACLIGAGLLAAGLGLMAWAVQQDYVAIAVAMVVMTAGLRTVMTICAVALVGALPENRTSMGAAMNDTAQELGTSVGTAVVGTLIAALVTVSLPTGAWAPALVASFFHGEQAVFIVLAVAVGVISGVGALTLTDARTVDEHAPEEQEHVPAV